MTQTGDKTESQERTLFTIGHGTRTLEDFVALLREHGIDVVVDVRTSPYSAYVPVYNREALSTALRAHGFRYIFLGEELGGRPEGDEYYTNGHADYGKMATRPEFKAGLERLENGVAQGYRLALLCSELKPEACHRTRLVAKELVHRGMNIQHIDEEGRLVSHNDVMARITGGQTELFGEAGTTLLSPRRIRRG